MRKGGDSVGGGGEHKQPWMKIKLRERREQREEGGERKNKSE